MFPFGRSCSHVYVNSIGLVPKSKRDGEAFHHRVNDVVFSVLLPLSYSYVHDVLDLLRRTCENRSETLLPSDPVHPYDQHLLEIVSGHNIM